MNTDEMKTVRRAAALVGGGLAVGGVAMAIGLFLAADRLAGRLESAVTSHGTMTRDAGARVGDSLEKTTSAVENHASAVMKAGEKISNPQIRVVDPMPIQQPVTIKGPTDDGSIFINARVGK